MTDNKLNIAVSGGSANFGNISQGDGNSNLVRSQTMQVATEHAFADFFEELERWRAEQLAPPRQIDTLKDEVAALKTAIESRTANKKSFGETAKAIYEHYGWAGDLLKKLLAVVVPGWLPS